MLTPETAAKIDQGIRLLRADQQRLLAPPPGSPGALRALAERAGVSEATIRHVEAIALARVGAALLSDPDLPPHLRKLAANYLTNPTSSKP